MREVEYTDEFEEWWTTLTVPKQTAIDDAVAVLEELGPGLSRPWVDTVKASRHPNMKELRPRGGHIRILFAFDPRRTAIFLIGGDKTGHWQEWYAGMAPVAARLYDEHLSDIAGDATP